jgi:hypothetical protein
MASGRKITSWVVATVIVAGAIAMIVVAVRKARPITLRGAVLSQDADPQKQLPIGDVQITGTNGRAVATGKSDPSGFFSLTLPKELRRRQSVKLQLRHPDYQPLDLDEYVANKLYIVHMVPRVGHVQGKSDRPEIVVSNVRVRYAVKTTTEADVGSAVKTFQATNTGNTPCKGKDPCSPDGKWKATVTAATLDAGEGNQFRNARVSCIAGPCAFSNIEAQSASRGGRDFIVSVRNWSDTATFLLEAEVVHPMVSDIVRESYPVIFGQALNFSLSPPAEGPSLEAELGGESIIFPLGPELFLSWADCHTTEEKDQTKVYRCALKPGYRFR